MSSTTRPYLAIARTRTTQKTPKPELGARKNARWSTHDQIFGVDAVILLRIKGALAPTFTATMGAKGMPLITYMTATPPPTRAIPPVIPQ